MDTKLPATIFLCLACAVLLARASSPPNMKQPKYNTYQDIWKDNIQNQNPNVPLEHQTRSDAMQLYSIRSKQIVKVKETREKSWEQPKYEVVLTPKTRGRRDNKFVTETVSYQRLKIRSADNQKYLCARTNGDIVFKDTADKQTNEASSLLLQVDDDTDNIDDDTTRAYSALSTKADKKNKPRKRCLFHWQFTKQMHIQLSLEAGDNKRFFLSVKDNVISLREENDTNELERSFIWLPTKPLKGQARKIMNFGNGRSRKFGEEPVFTPTSVAEAVLKEKDEQIETLLKEVTRLKSRVRQIRDLERQMEKITKS